MFDYCDKLTIIISPQSSLDVPRIVAHHKTRSFIFMGHLMRLCYYIMIGLLMTTTTEVTLAHSRQSDNDGPIKSILIII